MNRREEVALTESGLSHIRDAVDRRRAAERTVDSRRLLVYGLVRGQPVRFRKNPKSYWTYGTVLRVEDDGSLYVSAQGKTRSLRAELVECQRFGPRGGRYWVGCSRVIDAP